MWHLLNIFLQFQLSDKNENGRKIFFLTQHKDKVELNLTHSLDVKEQPEQEFEFE